MYETIVEDDDFVIDNLDDNTEEYRNITPLTPEKHLSSPITTTLLERLHKILDTIAIDEKHIKLSGPFPPRVNAFTNYFRRYPHEAYSSLKKYAYQFCSALDFCAVRPQTLTAHDYPFLFSLTAETSYRLQTDFKLAKDIFAQELDAYLFHMSGLLNHKQINALREKLTPPTTLGLRVVTSARQVQLWSDIVEKYRYNYAKNNQMRKLTIGPLRVILCDGFLLIKHDIFTEWKLLTFEQLQMIQDCCLARHNVELALQFNFHNGTKMLTQHVDSILRWQEDVLVKLGNDGYELVKAPESVFKAWINSLTNGDLLTYSSYDRTLDKMRDKERDLQSTYDLTGAMHRIVLTVTDLHDAAELFGLAKLSGHPTVDPYKSARSVRKEAQGRGRVLPFAMKQTVRMFKHLTISGYLNKNGEWPPFFCEPALDTTLRRLYLNRVTSLPIGCYPLNEIDSIIFGKFCEVDYSEDYLKFMDDKAICPGASEMSKFWFNGQKDETRRLLQKTIELHHIDMIALIERFRKGQFNEEELVIELTQKERELKIAARCFCKLTYNVRLFFTYTEWLLKKQFMGHYMPQQTMTMSNTETKQRLYNLTRGAKAKNRTFLEVDYSRWNLRMRHTTVDPIAEILNDIFGLPGLFTQAHRFFERATVVMTDKHSLPAGADPDVPVTRWPVSDLVWRGTHEGGFEGIQQALWTTFTIAMMYWVLYDQNLAFIMAGQGDNQVFVLTFDESVEDSAHQLRKLLAIMEVRCSFLNHTVKPEECIDSQTVLTYSKDIYVDGNHVLYNLKFAARSFRREEVDIPSLSTEISSISASAVACADNVYETPRAIFWKTYQTLRFLSNRRSSKNYEPEHVSLSKLLLNKKLLKFAILLPGSLGGLPTMSWTRFFIKGEVDDLSWDVPAILTLAKEDPIFGWDMALLLEGNYTSSKPNLQQLILDPHSIPVERPKDLKRLVKDAIAQRLPALTKNEWLYQLISDKDDAAGRSLMETLATARPFYPEIMHDIYALSPSGIRDAMLARFTLTRTISNITGNPNFSREILGANARLLDFVIKRYDAAALKRGVPVLPKTAYDTCIRLRKLWGPDIEHKNIGVYNPFDFKLKFADSSVPMISASSRCAGKSLTTEIGPYPPNFGTHTRQKLGNHGITVISSSSTVADLKRLVVLFSELGSTPELDEILSRISIARCPRTIRQLATILPTAYGGTAAHRHAALNRSAFSILGSRTVPTHLNFCTDLAGKLSGGEFDYPVAFQEFTLVLTNIYQVLTTYDLLDVNASIGFALTDDYEPLPTEPVVCDPPKIECNWEVTTNNKLVYISNFQIAEQPDVPAVNQVPHVQSKNIPPAVLVYNKLLAKYCSIRKLFSSTSVVNLPVDLIDMKEFTHCPFLDLIAGTCYFIQTMSVYLTITEYTKDANVFLSATIRKMCNSCSGLLTRMMLHPLFQGTQQAKEAGVLCTPGQSGARAAADNFAGELYTYTYLNISARSMLTKNIPLILFADYMSYGATISEMHAYSLIAMQSYDPKKILVTGYQRSMLVAARQGLYFSSRALTVALNFRATVHELARGRRLRNEQGANSFDTKFVLQYCNETPEEAIRALRELPLDERRQITILDPPPLSFGPTKGKCIIEDTSFDGSLRPTHTCSDTDERNRRADRFLSLLVRPLGVYSSAVSVWLSIFKMYKKSFIKKRVVSIGVGHGAVAASALMLSAYQVYGIDLRSSFPIITQREATYIPPEVVETGMLAKFKWSNFVSTCGGDVIQNADKLTDTEAADTWVIDIEQDFNELEPVLDHVPIGVTLIVRFICCADWAMFAYDAMNATGCYNTSAVRTTHKQSYIMICENFRGYNKNANYQRYAITSCSPWKSSVIKDLKYSVRRVNHFLRPVGESVKVISSHELLRISEKLRNDALNSPYADIREILNAKSIALSNVANFFLDLPTMVNVKERIHLLSSDEQRLFAGWYSNTQLPLDEISYPLLS
ncbi:RNA-dependent RNA polymerase [Sclerotinia sclerotiorum negative-stranded RNA virus 7]|nr:RNA-dependent RNA polymerase [Sclerotinia sclerotiorum negative-stranded RNA virus 7]